MNADACRIGSGSNNSSKQVSQGTRSSRPACAAADPAHRPACAGAAAADSQASTAVVSIAIDRLAPSTDRPACAAGVSSSLPPTVTSRFPPSAGPRPQGHLRGAPASKQHLKSSRNCKAVVQQFRGSERPRGLLLQTPLLELPPLAAAGRLAPLAALPDSLQERRRPPLAAAPAWQQPMSHVQPAALPRQPQSALRLTPALPQLSKSSASCRNAGLQFRSLRGPCDGAAVVRRREDCEYSEASSLIKCTWLPAMVSTSEG